MIPPPARFRRPIGYTPEGETIAGETFCVDSDRPSANSQVVG